MKKKTQKAKIEKPTRLENDEIDPDLYDEDGFYIGDTFGEYVNSIEADVS